MADRVTTRRRSRHRRPTPANRAVVRILVVLTLSLGTNYVVWRWFNSVNWNVWWIAVPLVVAETYSLVDAFLFGITMWRVKERGEPMTPDPDPPAALPDPDMSYRAYVQPWVGKPASPPSATATTTAGHTTVYASWNGATQVKSWEVVSGSSGSGPKAQVIGRAKRGGFETAIHVDTTAPSYKVVAIDATGHVLGTSKAFTAKG